MEINFREHFVWLNESTFEAILRRSCKNDKLQVISLNIQEALPRGENNSSQMLRVTVRYNDGSSEVVESFIVKGMVILFDPSIIAEMKLFEKEIRIYTQVIPAITKLLQSIGDDSALSAKLLGASEELSYLVFEDLSAKKYSNVLRRTGFNIKDFRYVFKMAAKWHACTAVILERNPEMLSYFRKCSYDKDNLTWREIIENVSISLSDACQFLPDFHHLSAKIKAGQATVFERFCKAAAASTDGFNVLIHGDMWSNNIMFQRHPKTLEIQNALFVDFQMSYITSPMLDIIYAFFTSSNEDLSVEHWMELINFYHGELTTLLKVLGYSGRIPQLSDFTTEMINRGLVGVMFGLFMLAMRNLQDDERLDMKKILSDREEDRVYRRDLMLRPACRKGLKFVLNFIDRNGLLDN